MIRLAPNARTLARGERDGTLIVSHIATSQVCWSQAAHPAPICALEWSPDGLWLASGGRDGMLRIFQADNGFCCVSLEHEHPVRRLLWSLDSRSLCAISGHTLHLIQLPTQTGLASDSIHFSPQ